MLSGHFFSSLRIDFDERCGMMIFITAELYRNIGMNPQPSQDIVNIFATVAIILGAFYAYVAYGDIMSGIIQPPNYDLFQLGTIEENTQVVVMQDKSNSFESQQLYLDCIDTLIAVGYKKSEAKKRAKAIFSKHNPQPASVQEFLNIVMKK
jgi:hypothetical protein